MADKGKESSGEEDEDGLWLWRYVTRSVRPLWKGREDEAAPPGRKKETPREMAAGSDRAFLQKELPQKDPQQKKLSAAVQPEQHAGQNSGLYPGQHPGLGLDRRSDEKLRRGRMEIEGRLDLHGHGRDRAYELLRFFIEDAYAREKRCVLVITGKGRGDVPGVLRGAVPGWLSTAPLGALVLRFYPAQPRDGGTGALYVLLRRQRE